MIMLHSNMLSAQHANDYQVSASIGTYTPIMGTFLTTSTADDGGATLTLPVPFNYCGSNRSSLYITPNGILIFDATSSSYDNALASATRCNVLAPFWDDLEALTTNNSISWELDDTDPANSILTIQYKDVFRRSNSSELLNFQVKLYYATGKIEFVYGAGFDGITETTTASIGINSRRASTTYFVSITPTGPGTMTYSTSTANNSIDATVAAHIASGTTYTFEPPACVFPNNMVLSGVSDDGATITWDVNNNALGWLVSYMETGGTWSDEEFITTNEYIWDEGDLTPSTPYTFRIATLCDVIDTSNYVDLTFTTMCPFIMTLPWSENFDTHGTGETAFAPCWERYNNNTPSTENPYIIDDENVSAPGAMYFSDSRSLTLVSPPFEEDVNQLAVSFWLMREGASSGTFSVGYLATSGDPSSFVAMTTLDIASDTWVENTIYLSSVPTGVKQFAFRQNQESIYWYYWLDDVTVDYLPDCIFPMNLTASDNR
ncbi:MAG: fibronectin type III domain-containing protein [Bacteroidales bacterium]|nr:fibronectin type III domain-containing protein [Bacteroidales bacterium]